MRNPAYENKCTIIYKINEDIIVIKNLINHFFRIEKVNKHNVMHFCGLKLRLRINKNNTKCRYKIAGQNNKIIIIENGKERELKRFKKIKGLKIDIGGSNNLIRINKPAKYINSKIFIRANDSCICIGKSDFLHNLQINVGCRNSQFLEIGDHTNCCGLNIFLNEHKAGCIIGKNCLFSSPITIWSTDGHVITEQETKKIINHIKTPVTIGNNCWIGTFCILTKNAILPNYTICGAGSVITKKFEQEHTLLAGNPAKIIKEGINWSPKTPTEFNNIIQGETNA